MRIWAGQIYIKPEANFPFSHRMQRWLGEELSALSGEAGQFQARHGSDFELMLRISADVGTTENAIRGPTIFKKDRDVEYTLFLPFDAIMKSAGGLRTAAEFLLDGIRTIFQKAGIEVAQLDEKRASIVDHLCSDPTMLTGPWPSREGPKEGP